MLLLHLSFWRATATNAGKLQGSGMLCGVLWTRKMTADLTMLSARPSPPPPPLPPPPIPEPEERSLFLVKFRRAVLRLLSRAALLISSTPRDCAQGKASGRGLKVIDRHGGT